MRSWHAKRLMPKNAGARISWWIPRTVLIPCAPESGTFWPRLLRCRNGDPDSLFLRFVLMREIVLDTETTGLDPLRGDRLVEIGCVEIFNRMPTGQTFHRHINPERDTPAEAFAVHGLSSALRAGRVFEARRLARVKHPGVSNRLDDLCSRYAIDNSRRTKHGALLDAELLAEVYIDLIGARQSQLILATETRDIRIDGYGEMARRQREIPLAPRVTEDDRLAHRAFIATLGAKPIWNDFLSAG